MRRSSLEHLIRAAASVTGDNEIVIIGSQAIHGSLTNVPTAAQMSIEADMYPRNKPDGWNDIEGVLGELSPFHDTHQYYAQGVGPETAILPKNWEERTTLINNEATNGATGICVGMYDLVLAKYAAGREKDFLFIGELIINDHLDKQTLLGLVNEMPEDRCDKNLITNFITRDFDTQDLIRAKSRINSLETNFIHKLSVVEPDLAMYLLEARERSPYLVQRLVLEPASNNEMTSLQDKVADAGAEVTKLVTEMGKHWKTLKQLDPGVLSMTGAAVTLDSTNNTLTKGLSSGSLGASLSASKADGLENDRVSPKPGS
jgi:DNA-binding cell septation regulator SpoVG